ncbi:MAG TPA: YncE family protein, partial [Bryobacteraceae bacterium]|nr:YncE family protein [Bryobacteraceae bacterium]
MRLAILLSLPVVCAAQLVGPQPDGTIMLNTGWRVKPAGTSIALSTMPMSRVLSPDKQFLYVMNGGYQPPSISVVDTRAKSEIQRVNLTNAWRGLALNADGSVPYAALGPLMKISRFRVSNGRLTHDGDIDLSVQAKTGEAHMLGDMVIASSGERLIVADSPQNKVFVLRLPAGTVERTISTGATPYAVLLDPADQDLLWVSHWTGSSVGAFSISTGEPQATIPTGPHPSELAWVGSRLAVAAANTNQVEFYEKRKAGWRATELVNLAFTPKQPVGMTPSALALSPDGKTLLTVCSDANTVAVVDVGGKRVRVAGYLPAGWYPTGATWVDKQVIVLNGRGSRSLPNPNGPNPVKRVPGRPSPPDLQYVLRIQTGSAQFIDPWDDAVLAGYTKLVQSLSPWRDALLTNAGAPPDNPVPDRPGAPSPIKHVILLMKENRTYDQVL